MRRWFMVLLPLVAAIAISAVMSDILSQPAGAQEKKEEAGEKSGSFFDNSLHATGEGMRYWYEEENGFKEIMGIPYSDLACKNCHADTCDKCHKDEKDGTPVFSLKKSRDEKTCLACHKRTGAGRKFDKKAGIEDVHAAAGLTCTDCHSAVDVHGDGKKYTSMRSPDAVKVSCTTSECHCDLDMEIRPHSVHKKAKIHCNACHVSSTITCVNCHFDDYLARGEKRVAGENFFPGKSWTLLVNHEGWVTTGNSQTLVGKGKKFVTYVPYFTHSVVKEGRQCTNCHGTDAAKKMAKGEKVEMGRFENGKITHFEGVVPFVPELMEWPWLDKDKDGKWVLIETEEKPLIQKAAYAEPFTESQLKKLQAPFKK